MAALPVFGFKPFQDPTDSATAFVSVRRIRIHGGPLQLISTKLQSDSRRDFTHPSNGN
jgi:hypothetical protein